MLGEIRIRREPPLPGSARTSGETPGLEGVRTGFGEGGSHTAPTAPGRTGATAGVDGGKILMEGEKNASLLRNQLGQECGHLRTGN